METNNLREQIKIELKTFGCQWDLIGDTDPEEISNDSADQILSLVLAKAEGVRKQNPFEAPPNTQIPYLEYYDKSLQRIGFNSACEAIIKAIGVKPC